jgi:CRISPR-associated protein Cmr5
MKQQLTQQIQLAIEAIKAVSIPSKRKVKGITIDSVASQYHGYISSLGAGIIQAGLLPAVIFFENSEGEESKYKITQAIHFMVEKDLNSEYASPASLSKSALSEYILAKALLNDPRFLKEVSQHAIALKIALRTFQKHTK